MGWWRQARAIALLPGMAAIVVPALILALGDGPDIGWGFGPVAAALVSLLGIGLLGAGLAVWVWTVRLLRRIGRGTLAPWDPTSKLVVHGPYRHMRNPMITAVLAVLTGEAILFGSPSIGAWAAIFFALNLLFFPLVEEPGLERRFGDEYRAYKRSVPRWLPRRRPYDPGRR